MELTLETKKNYMFVGGDFSQQEPRLLAAYSNDETMIQAYKDQKDLYATIAAGVYHNDYWDNMEHRQDGSANPEGKKRRSACKSLLLGMMYGRGPSSIAEQIGSSVQEAQGIIDNFYGQFPKVKVWMDDTQTFAKENGYVEDMWGRRRRLPDIQLPKYTVKMKNKVDSFNPLLYTMGKVNDESSKLIAKYNKKLEGVVYKKDYSVIQQEAEKEGVVIINNGAFISQAERQCVNARIQGGAASMTKVCMRKIFDNEELKKLDAHLAIQIHDEVIMEVPEENAEKAAEILSLTMRTCVKDTVVTPFKCDTYVVKKWYEDDFGDSLKMYKKKYMDKGMSEEEAFNKLLEENSELTEEELIKLLS